MKIKFMAIASVFLLVVGFSMSAHAGAVTDTDADGVPDAFDVCPAVPDPLQTDTDTDGSGDACDCDNDNDGFILGSDIVNILNEFGTGPGANTLLDNTLDGFILGDDVVNCLNIFGQTFP